MILRALINRRMYVSWSGLLSHSLPLEYTLGRETTALPIVRAGFQALPAPRLCATNVISDHGLEANTSILSMPVHP